MNIDDPEAQDVMRRIENGGDPCIEGMFLRAKSVQDRYLEQTGETLELKDALQLAAQLNLAHHIDRAVDQLWEIQDAISELDKTVQVS